MSEFPPISLISVEQKKLKRLQLEVKAISKSASKYKNVYGFVPRGDIQSQLFRNRTPITPNSNEKGNIDKKLQISGVSVASRSNFLFEKIVDDFEASTKDSKNYKSNIQTGEASQPSKFDYYTSRYLSYTPVSSSEG